LAGEVLVEAAARQPGRTHDLVDRYVGEAVAVEQPPRALDDALPRSFLVLFRVGHVTVLPRCRRDDSSMTEDVLEHLLCALLMKVPHPATTRATGGPHDDATVQAFGAGRAGSVPA